MVEVINGLSLFCGRTFESLMRSTWQGSLLICLVLAGTMLWRRGPACTKYALWMLVIIKFLVPFQLHLPTGRVNPLTYTPAPVMDIAANYIALTRLAVGSTTPTLAHNPAEGLSLFNSWSIWQICGAIWLIASGLILIIGIWRYWRMRRLLVRASNPIARSLQSQVDQLKGKIGYRRSLAVLESEAIDSPLVTGLFRPLMILPGQFFFLLAPDEQQAIVTHELCHLKRRDHLVMWLEHVVFSIQFFNPLTWLALRRLRAERERACDDQVLDLLSGRTSEYGEALLKAVRYRQDYARGIPNALALIERGHETARRIRRILSPSRPIVARISIPAMMILLVIGTALVSSRDVQDQESNSDYEYFNYQASESAGKSTEMSRSETDRARFAPVMNRLIGAINNNNYLTIYLMFTPGMQHAFPLSKTAAFFNNLSRKYGRINSLGIKKFINPSKVICPVYFELGLVDMTVFLDQQDKIDELLFLPHTQVDFISSKSEQTENKNEYSPIKGDIVDNDQGEKG